MFIYAAVGAFGLLILLIMLAAGEMFGGHDVTHDFSHAVEGDSGGPSVFSIRIMAAFLTAFGVGGIVGRYYGLSHPVSSGVGVAAGLVMATIVFQFAKILYAQQASSVLRMHGMVGSAADVSVAIPNGGVGQISLSVDGARSEHIARSADGRPIARGTPVVITGVGGEGVIVSIPGERPAGGLQ